MSDAALMPKTPSAAEEGGEAEIKDIMNRLSVHLADIAANPPAPDQFIHSKKYDEIVSLSDRLVGMGACECQNPNEVVAAAIHFHSAGKYTTALKKQTAAEQKRTAELERVSTLLKVAGEKLHAAMAEQGIGPTVPDDEHVAALLAELEAAKSESESDKQLELLHKQAEEALQKALQV